METIFPKTRTYGADDMESLYACAPDAFTDVEGETYFGELVTVWKTDESGASIPSVMRVPRGRPS